MKKSARNKPDKKVIIILVALLMVLASLSYIWIHWVREIHQERAVKNTLTQELKPLLSSLDSLGFDASITDASCQHSGNKVQYCEATATKYTVIKSDPASLHTYATQLSELLDQNDWHQRDDYPTISWFDNIGKQIDYQPDQLNTKQIGNIECTLDFFTSFSKPAPAAVTMRAYCSQGTPVIQPLD